MSRLDGVGGVEPRVRYEDSDVTVVGVSDLMLWFRDLWERPTSLPPQYLHLQFDGSRDGSLSSQAAWGANSAADLNCLTWLEPRIRSGVNVQLSPNYAKHTSQVSILPPAFCRSTEEATPVRKAFDLDISPLCSPKQVMFHRRCRKCVPHTWVVQKFREVNRQFLEELNPIFAGGGQMV